MHNDNLFPTWPSFTQEEADKIQQILLSNKVNYWTGQECRKFEQEFANFCNTKYAVAVANGTVALDLALKAINIQPNNEVITTSRTFLATVSSIVNANAKPIFADLDLNSQNITSETIKPLITAKTKAIIVVHLAGMPAEMDEIMELAEKHNLYVIEDCAQAHGAKYKGKPVGSIGHIGAWSFCQDKIMTTGGEGGMVTTNDKNLWHKMWAYKDHGKDYATVYNKKHAEGFRWLHNSFGTNWRLTEIQAGIGRIQLTRMQEWIAIRQFNAGQINQAVKDLNIIRFIKIPEYIEHACYKHYLFINPKFLAKNWNRDKIIKEITKHGIPAFQGSCSEVYLEKAFDNTDLKPKKRLKNAKILGETSLMFLVHPTINQQDIQQASQIIREALIKASIKN